MDEDQVVDRVFSKSYMTEGHLNGEKRKQVEQQLRKVIREGDKEWVDKDVSGVLCELTSERDVQVPVLDGHCRPSQEMNSHSPHGS